MQRNKQLYEIIDKIDQQRLGSAISLLENVLLANPKLGSTDLLERIKDDYGLMKHYWQDGFQDPQRQQLYHRALRRLYDQVAAILTSDWLQQSTFLTLVAQRSRQTGKDRSIEHVRQQLEAFTSDVVMLELEQPHVRQAKEDALYESHQQLMRNLFETILTSDPWTDDLMAGYTELLLSPTVDVIDQQLILSAVMLSAMAVFDPRKLSTLLTIYRQSSTVETRQRALVAWVLTVDGHDMSIFPDISTQMQQLLDDEACCKEIVELQMQMLYCMSAEDDEQKIKDEILPNIMKGSHVKMTDRGLTEMDEDTLEEILHSDETERHVEQMEQSMKRMVDMQKQGADIYFGGFAQMKRFPFFSDLSNWFVPFYPQHPSISKIWNHTKGGKFLRLITEVGAFCDSDKYSFVLAFEKVLSQLPANMLQMVERGEASPIPLGGEISRDEQAQPAFVRRVYLQNLYRFFRLYSYRSEFRNPFVLTADKGGAVFLASPLLCGGRMQHHLADVSKFLAKRGLYDQALTVLENTAGHQRNAAFYLLKATLLQRRHGIASPGVYANAQQAVMLDPDNEQALSVFARAAFSVPHFDEALQAYEKLLARKPDSRSYLLNAAICQTNMALYDEAEKRLFKLHYLYPDDLAVQRVLAWTLTQTGKYQQAEGYFRTLLAQDNPQPVDFLNHGYFCWLSGQVTEAIASFRRFMQCEGCEQYDMAQELMVTNRPLLEQGQIGDVEIRMMLDALNVM